jgi:HK97 gp10 family phage protein
MARTISTSSKAFKLEGVPELKKTLAALRKGLSAQGNDALSKEVRECLLVPCMMMRDEAKDLAPVKTGNLRRAIYAKEGRGPSAYVAVDRTIAPYAGMVERGTSRMAAEPYFRPAINAVKPLAANLIADRLPDVIERIAAEHAWKAPS